MSADGRPVPGSVWFYAPNNVAPFPFAVLFAVAGVIHFYKCVRYKSFLVTGYLPFVCANFAAGFALRGYGAFDYGHVGVYIASTLLIYMSPPILELANYHILGRTMYYLPYFAPIHPGRVLTTLGSLSSVVEILNALGVAYYATSRTPDKKNYALSHNLMRASLALQFAVIALFYTLAAVYHRRCARARLDHPRVRAVLWTLYVSMALILARTVYRAVEHFAVPIHVPKGFDPMELNPIVRYEWFFWVFEAVPMLVNVWLWVVRHPRRYLPQSHKVYIAQDGETELEGPGWGDKRNVVMTTIDPFGLLAMCEKERKGTAYWEENGYHHLLERKGQQEGV